MGDLADKVNKYIHNKIKKDISAIKRLQKEKNYGIWDISLDGDKFDNENYRNGFLEPHFYSGNVFKPHLYNRNVFLRASFLL